MPLVNVKVIEGVFSSEQKQDMVRHLTEAMVEIEGERVLAASCIRRPAENMVVKSATERAKKARDTPDVSSSRQYGLLLPPWVRHTSSPAVISRPSRGRTPRAEK